MEVSFKPYIKKKFFLYFSDPGKYSYICAYNNISIEPNDGNDIGG